MGRLQNQRHKVLQRELYKLLVREISRDRIGYEVGNVDMIVTTGEGRDYYEIKTADTAKHCIREALGQLLEYSYWPGNVCADRLIVLSECAADGIAVQYLEWLRTSFNLPVFYQQIRVTGNVASVSGLY